MRVSLPRQFLILSKRTWRNLYRNPMLMLTHYAVAVVLAVLSGWLFYGVTDDIGAFQNRLGLFFFLLALFGFSTLTSLTVFSSERLIFMRERANGYYSPITYFAAKVVFDVVPLRLIPPICDGHHHLSDGRACAELGPILHLHSGLGTLQPCSSSNLFDYRNSIQATGCGKPDGQLGNAVQSAICWATSESEPRFYASGDARATDGESSFRTVLHLTMPD